MKTIGKLKLNKLSQAQLSGNEQNRLKGGTNCCICGCHYSNQGGSSSTDNSNANFAGGSSGLYSPQGGGGSGAFGQ